MNRRERRIAKRLARRVVKRPEHRHNVQIIKDENWAVDDDDIIQHVAQKAEDRVRDAHTAG